MAPKTGPTLKELMRNRNKVPSLHDKGKSKQSANPPPPPPQVPADLGLKPNPDLRRKRPVEPTEEGELGPSRGNKQARPTQERRGRRAHSVESREEQPVAQGRRSPRTWSPALEGDGAPIAMDASLRHFRGGHVGRMTDALLQPLLLPIDNPAYRSFDHPGLFLSIKRDLAMVSNSVHHFFYYFCLLTYYFLNLSHFFTVHNRSRNKFTWLRSGGRAFVMRQRLPTRPERLQRLI